MGNRLFLLFQLCYFVSLTAQTDSLATYDLHTLTVAGGREAALPITAPLGRVDLAELANFNSESPLAGVNSIPGVRFEERAPGSYRLSIRGSALRAPFGVRNVKVYWNGFPLTEPGGDTPLNTLDAVNMPSIILFKGPAGSRYGSGTGGAMLINGDAPGRKKFNSLQAEGGSFGYGRLAFMHQRRRKNGDQETIRLSHQRTDGYRDHSQFERSTAELYFHRPAPDRNSGVKINALLSDLDYEIPGGLNPEQFAENPRQARPNSSTTKSGIRQQTFLAGLSYYSQLGNHWRHDSKVYVTGNQFENPFVVDYKRESNLGSGLRTVAQGDYQLASSTQLNIAAGLEAQWTKKNASNFTAETGSPGALNFVDDIDTRQFLVFSSAQLTLDRGWIADLRISGQQLNYQIDRSFNVRGATGRTEAGFNFVLAPRLSIAKSFKWGGLPHSFFIAYGRAYSPPTLREFRTNEGSINVDLRPERGDAFEVGFKRNSIVGFNLDLNIYYQLLNESITTFQDSSGVQLFRNAGGNQTFGVEAALSRELIPKVKEEQWLQSLFFQLAFTYQNGRYRDYITGGQDFSDQPLPGLSPRTLDLRLSMKFKANYYARLGWYTAARTPLNDANEVFAEAFNVIRLRLGKELLVGGKQLDLYGGVNNLLNEDFSFGYDLNPQFGNRYFQPAAGINFYLGAHLYFGE